MCASRSCVAVIVSLLGACVEYDLGPVDVNPGEVVECDFVQDEDVPEVWEYSCNPVFAPTGESWLASMGDTSFSAVEVLGHPFYQVWYIGNANAGADGGDQFGYASSDDGIEWATHPENPGWPERQPDDWDWGALQTPSVTWDPNAAAFLMLYGGISAGHEVYGIGVASSRDGANWQLSDQNPVVPLGFYVNGVDYAWPLTVTAHEGDDYTAYFAGTPAGGDGDVQDIYRLTSDDPERWDQPATPVLSFGDGDAWDRFGVASADIVELDGRLYMFYVGIGDWVYQGDYRSVDKCYVGLAISDDDGESWERWSDGYLPLHRTAGGDVFAIGAQAIGSRIHLWVTDWYTENASTAIGYYLFVPE